MRGGVDCFAILLVLIIFCLSLIIQGPGVLPLMKTLNHELYIQGEEIRERGEKKNNNAVVITASSACDQK